MFFRHWVSPLGFATGNWEEASLKFIRILLILAVPLGLAAYLVVLNPPEYTPEGTQSREFFQPGEFSVAEQEWTLVDDSRPTPRNGDYEGANSRTLETLIWYPLQPASKESVAKPDKAMPLLVYSHGFMSMREEGRYLARYLASHGYVVMSANYPLTNYFSPGDPTILDLPNQPADVSFLIDTMLALNQDPGSPFFERIDEERIGVAGLSLGGMTSTLVAYHREIRDDRVAVAVSIAGPSSMFGPQFFEPAAVPMLMVAGDIDAMVDYELNARPFLERAPLSTLVTIEGATHVGFSNISPYLFRWMDNPDNIGCRNLKKHMPENGDFLLPLGGSENGMIEAPRKFPCEEFPLPNSIRPGEQQMLTILAVFNFLESHLALEEDVREKHASFLAEIFALENSRIRVEFPDLAYEATASN